MAEVVLRSLVKEFPGGVTAVDRLDLEIADGEFFALLGPSGCGKTTLLRTIAGLETPTGGTIEIGGRDVTRVQPGGRDVAMVFQDYALYPHMTVVDNIAYPLKVKRVPRAERHRAAAEAGASLQLEATMERRPGQLSGGQQQRVALARAIAYRPQVFLFDEPLSTWTRGCGWRPAASSSASSTSWARPRCTSPTTSPRPWPWPTGWR